MEEQRDISVKEIQIIKKYFTDNEPLLQMIRGLFFGLPTSAAEKQIIKDTFADPELFALISKKLLPQLSKGAPIGQISDVWLGAEQMVFGQSPEAIYQAVWYKQRAIDMTNHALALLVNPDGNPVHLEYVPASGAMSDMNAAMQVQLLARNQYIRHIEQQLLFLWIIAQQKDGTATGKDINSSK